MKNVLDIFKNIFENIDKKYLYIGGGFIGLMLFATIFGACNRGSGGGIVVKNYEDIKAVMVEAAQKYYEDNQIYLPSVGEKTQITDKALTSQGYMKDLSSYAPKDVECSGKVVLTRLDRYENSFVAFLDCGEAFTELALYETILEENPITESGNGLYEMGDLKVFRGEPKNNYVKINDRLYRVLSIDKNNNITVLYEQRVDRRRDNYLDVTYHWDDRLNNEKMEVIGINEFELSRFKDILIELSNNEQLITEELKPTLVKRNLCVGKIDLTDEVIDNSLECSLLSNDQYYVGALTASEIIRASLDPDCDKMNAINCINYNFLLDKSNTFWSLTATKANTYQLITTGSKGLSLSDARNYYRFKPTLVLGNTTVKLKGDGTIDNPYVILKETGKK